jgi:cyclohexyl-isocyanide hydratase
VTAGIDFAFVLTATVRGEAHARLIQLGLEYDPAPPFDCGSPDKAGPDLVAAYGERMRALAPDREDRIRAVARKIDAADG